ncbi:UNVERIFIED_CONTAM: hypothetical protein GTU68_003601 [Idotea baltica]|nr:hypothetical protein [Idotea baltica]
MTREFQILETEPLYKFKIIVKSEDYDEEDDENEGAAVDLIFEYTPTYPDEPPVVEVCPVHNLEDQNIEDLKNELLEQCTENLGMVMVFTLVSFTLEWINNKIEEDKRREEEIELSKKRAEEELERKKFEGTRVTVESFLAWKTKFDAKRLIGVEKKEDDDKNRKLTGKELFLTDATLNVSDLNFLGTEDEVTVDESLFQDLDDLDLGDDLEDEDDLPGDGD